MPGGDAEAVERVIARVRGVYGGWRRDTPVTQMRADWDRLFSAPGPAELEAVDAGGVPCAWLRAPGARRDRAVLYVHGGGLQMGSLQSHRELMGELSVAAGVAVLGVGYRLAPEHRQPDALQDVLQVLAWLHAQGLSGAQLALAGDSAGGGLVLSALMQLPDGVPRPAAACLMSAWTDMTTFGSSYDTRAATDPIHQRKMIQALARICLAAGQDAADPSASPLLAAPEQQARLPPLLLQVGDRETLLSDSVDMAAKVRAAGGQAECQAWPGMIHVFQQFPAELVSARQALADAGRFLARHLGVSGAKGTPQP